MRYACGVVRSVCCVCSAAPRAGTGALFVAGVVPNDAIAWTNCAVELPEAAPPPPDGLAAMPSTTQGAPTAPIDVPTKAFSLALYW